MLIFWGSRISPPNMSEKWIIATFRRSHCSEWEKASAGTNSGGVWSEAVWSRLSELIPGSQSDICLNYTGKSQDTARTDGESSLFPSHAPTHTNTLRFYRPAVWCVPKLNCFPSLGEFRLRVWHSYDVSNITGAGFTVTFHCAETAKPVLACRANWHFKILLKSNLNTFLWIISIIIVTHQLSLKFDQSRKLLLQVAFENHRRRPRGVEDMTVYRNIV